MNNNQEIQDKLRSLQHQEDIQIFMQHNAKMHMKMSKIAILTFNQPFLDYMLTCDSKNFHFEKFFYFLYCNKSSDNVSKSMSYLIQNDFMPKNILQDMYIEALISDNTILANIILDNTRYTDIHFFIKNEKLLSKILNLPDSKIQKLTENIPNHPLFSLKYLAVAISNKSAYVVKKIIENYTLDTLNQFAIKEAKELTLYNRPLTKDINNIETLVGYLGLILLDEYDNFEGLYTAHRNEKSYLTINMFTAAIEKIHDKNIFSDFERNVIERIIAFSYFKLTPLLNNLIKLDYSLSPYCLRNYVNLKNANQKNYVYLLKLSQEHLKHEPFIHELYNATLNFFRHEHFLALLDSGFSYKKEGEDNFYDTFFKRLLRAQFTKMKPENKENFLIYMNTILPIFTNNNFRNEESTYLCENVYKFKKEHLLCIPVFFEKNQLNKNIAYVNSDEVQKKQQRI